MKDYKCVVTIDERNRAKLEEAVRHFMIVQLGETIGQFDDVIKGVEIEIQVNGDPFKVTVSELIGKGVVLNRVLRRSVEDEDAAEFHSFVVVQLPHGWRIGQFAVVDSGDYGEHQDSMLKLAKFVYSDE